MCSESHRIGKESRLSTSIFVLLYLFFSSRWIFLDLLRDPEIAVCSSRCFFSRMASFAEFCRFYEANLFERQAYHITRRWFANQLETNHLKIPFAIRVTGSTISKIRENYLKFVTLITTKAVKLVTLFQLCMKRVLRLRFIGLRFISSTQIEHCNEMILFNAFVQLTWNELNRTCCWRKDRLPFRYQAEWCPR